jgi:dihydropteroate synthase
MDSRLHFSPFSATLHGKRVNFQRPVIMGILNATPDSFYDGGRYTSPDTILAHARQLLADGADIIDLGVVSSRPGAQLLEPEEEAERLVPLVRLLRQELPCETIISVDTCYSLPATKAAEAGADIINDISGGQFDPQMFSSVASLRLPYILMHTRGLPNVMQESYNTQYNNILDALSNYFQSKLEKLDNLGVQDVWLDPGFGFAKTTDQNYHLLLHLDQLIARFPFYPMLTALSNKSMITSRLASSQGTPDQYFPLPDSEFGTLVLNTLALRAGTRLLRVHTPRLAKVAINLLFPDSN